MASFRHRWPTAAVSTDEPQETEFRSQANLLNSLNLEEKKQYSKIGTIFAQYEPVAGNKMPF
jgi:hypothetical protein